MFTLSTASKTLGSTQLDENASTVNSQDLSTDFMFGITFDSKSTGRTWDTATDGPDLNESFFGLNSTNETNTVSGVDNKTATVIVSFVSVVAAATVLGNVSIILCIARNRNMLTIYNIYAASLACADLLVGIVVMSSMSVYTYHGYWPLGDDFCTIWVVFDFTCCTVSMLHLDAIAFDRYKSVTSPLLYRTTFTKSRAMKISVAMWLLGFALWVPPVLWFRINEKTQGILVAGDCYFIPDKYYILAQVSAAYYTPIVFMVVVYLLLFCALHKRKLNIAAREKKAKEVYTISSSSASGHINDAYVTSTDDTGEQAMGDPREPASFVTIAATETASSTDSPPSGIIEKTRSATTKDPWRQRPKTHRKDSEKAKITAQNRRCITTLGAIIIVFLICWLPFVSFWPIAAFCETCIPAEMYEGSYWMAYANSFVNPYIYFLLNRDFRAAFVNLFRRKGRRDSLQTISNMSTISAAEGKRISRA